MRMGTHLEFLFLLLLFTNTVLLDDCPINCSCTTIRKEKSGQGHGVKVSCSSRRLTVLRLPKLPKDTVEIDLSDNLIRTIQVDSFPRGRTNFTKVKKLTLRGNHIEEIQPGAFSKFPRLTKLYLEVNNLRTIKKDAFEGLGSLRLLNLSRNDLLHIDVNVFKHTRRLRKLSLIGNDLTTFLDGTFKGLPLKILELNKNDLMCDCGIEWMLKWIKKRNVGVPRAKCKYPVSLANFSIERLARADKNCKMMELPYFKLHPLNNQVVYQNDSISIKCSATWQPRGYLAWHKDGYEISHGFNDVTFFQNNDIVEKRNESTLLIRRLNVIHTGKYTCHVMDERKTYMAKSVSINVLGQKSPYCSLDKTKTMKGTFIWHNTAVGGRADYPCPYHDKVVNIKPKATRNCSVDGKWTNLDTSQCVYESRMTTMLYRHSEVNITEQNVKDVTKQLQNDLISKKYNRNFTEVIQIMYLAKMLKAICRYSRLQVVKDAITKIMNSLLAIDPAVLQRSEKERKLSLKLIKILEQFSRQSLNSKQKIVNGDNIVINPPITSGTVVYVHGFKLTRQQDVTYSLQFLRDGENNGKINHNARINQSAVVQDDLDVHLSVNMPKKLSLATLFTTMETSNNWITVTLIAYNKAVFFVETKSTEVLSRTSVINSAVVGVNVQVPFSDLTTDLKMPVTLTFRNHKVGRKPRLVYWSTDKTEGNRWEIAKGCSLEPTLATFTKFSCLQFPAKIVYYTVVMEIPSPPAKKLFRLELVTFIGAGLCSAFLLVTLMTYAFFRELRYNRNDAATLMNLCLALVVVITVFATGVNRTHNTMLCQALAVLLHYFLLCALLWLGCGGACLTVLVKKGTPTEEYNPVLKYYLVGWGLPLIICGITLAGDSSNYIAQDYCWLSPKASLWAFLAPGCLFILANMIVFVRLHALINRKLPENRVTEVRKRSNEHPMREQLDSRPSDATKYTFQYPERQELLDFLKGSLIVMLLICIQYGFAVMIFSYRDNPARYLYYLFAYGYAIGNALLGFSVLSFHCLRKKTVQHCWKSYLLRRTRQFSMQPDPCEQANLIQRGNVALQMFSGRNNLSVLSSDYNRDQSDIISGISGVPSVFTHDGPPSRPLSVTGQSVHTGVDITDHNPVELKPVKDPDKADLPDIIKLEPVHTVDVGPSSPRSTELSFPSTFRPPVSPGSGAENNSNAAGISKLGGITDYTITTVSERTFSDHSNLMSVGQSSVATDTKKDNIQKPRTVPANLRNIVPPNWRPVRRKGGADVSYYPYFVDTSLQIPQRGAPIPLTQNNPVTAVPVPSRVEAVGASSTHRDMSSSEKDQKVGDQRPLDLCASADHPSRDQINQRLESHVPLVPKVDSKEQRVLNQVSHYNKTQEGFQPARCKDRPKERKRFEDIPARQGIVYVPVPHVTKKQFELRSETSV